MTTFLMPLFYLLTKRNYIKLSPYLLILLIGLNNVEPAIATLKHSNDSIKIGILAYRNKALTQTTWQALSQYFHQQIPEYNFSINAYYYDELAHAVATRQVDFIFTNPSHYIQLKNTYNLSSPLASLVKDSAGHNLSAFAGVIFTLASRTDINSLKDLAHHRIAVTKIKSFGGYQMQAYALHAANLDAIETNQLYLTGMPHDNVVNAVLQGKADIGFVRTGVLESLQTQHLLDIKQLKIINAQAIPSFPLKLSTRLYPEWPFAALPHIESEIANHVAAALLLIHDDPVIQQLKIKDFAIPHDYLPVEQVLRTLRFPPFDKTPSFTLSDIWQRYAIPIVIFSTLSLLIGILSLFLFNLNRRLHKTFERNAMLVRALESSQTGVVITDIDANIQWVNLAFENLTGYSTQDVKGKSTKVLNSGQQSTEFYQQLWQTILTGKPWHGEVINRRKDNSLYYEELRISPIINQTGNITHFLSTKHDITERKALQDKLKHISEHDNLTNLPNRILLNERLTQALILAKRENNNLALIFLDLDKFKPVNDTFGHNTGDTLLKQVAERIQHCLRESDTVARVGGDEFIVLLPKIKHKQDVSIVAEKIRHSLNKPFLCDTHTVNISSSMGIALYPEHGNNSLDLSKNADTAMYYSKDNGRNNVKFFEYAMQTET